MPKTRHSYQLHIQLCDIKPLIWRRVVVSDLMTLAQLHALIQAAMGWDKRPDYLFELEGQRYGLPNADWAEDPTMDARRYTLAQLLNGQPMVVRYTYNLADEWVHRIKLESSAPLAGLEALHHLPLCLAGRNHCLPGQSGPDCVDSNTFDLPMVQSRIRALQLHPSTTPTPPTTADIGITAAA